MSKTEVGNKASLHTNNGIWIQKDDETVAAFFDRATSEDDILINYKVEGVRKSAKISTESWVEMERKIFEFAYGESND